MMDLLAPYLTQHNGQGIDYSKGQTDRHIELKRPGWGLEEEGWETWKGGGGGGGGGRAAFSFHFISYHYTRSLDSLYGFVSGMELSEKNPGGVKTHKNP
jgi:hypothetical protein